jgi:DnaJ-domain-containing protein 1
VITLLLVAGGIAFFLWKIVLVGLKTKGGPQPEPVERHPQICSDYWHYQLALKRWESDRQLFEKVESDRLKELGAWASKGGPLTGLAFLVGIVVTIFAANRAGSGAGWGTGIGSLIAVGAVMNAEEHFRRWRHQALFVRQEYNEPAPVYVPNGQPQPRTGPPPGQEPPPDSARIDPSMQKVTTMRQAYANLGIPPGRISIAEVRKIYRNLQNQYHPDKVMHLGKDFQELAARKSLSFNLAMEFIEQHYKKSS